MRVFLFVISLAIFFVLPNLAWLGTSTLRVENRSPKNIQDIGYGACEAEVVLKPLASGDWVFDFLPSCGDDTLIIRIGRNKFCQIYVEGELYHIDVEIHSPTKVTCEYDDPFSGLILAKMFL